MEKILIIEDSSAVSVMIAKLLSDNYFSYVICPDYKTAAEVLFREEFFAAIVDMNLPDSDWEKTTLLVNKYGVPIIIYSSEEYNAGVREQVLDKTILDYIQKKGEKSLQQLIMTLVRLRKNSHMKVLIVDDSESALKLAKFVLEQAKFQTFTAQNGNNAISILKENPDISIVLTDYEMPEFDGFELLKHIRTQFDRNSLAVIAVSHPSTKASISKFLKSGANDFIQKPYTNDELYCRIVNHAELVEAYREVNRLNQEKNYLLGMVSHDIRGPLGSVSGLCNILLENQDHTDHIKAEEAFKAISETSEQILSMVNSILDISNIRSDKFQLKPVFSSLTDLIQQRIDLIFFRNASLKDIQIIYKPEERLEFYFDKTRITQVLDNLISNAIKFTPKSGTVIIDLKKKDSKAFFRIKDTGPGLSAEDKKNCFKKYKTLSASPTDGEASIGLGLSICKKIINSHRGKIGVENRLEGGADFHFQLPLVYDL